MILLNTSTPIHDYQGEQTTIFFWTLIATAITAVLLFINLMFQGKSNRLTNKKFLYDIRPAFILVKKQIIDRSYLEGTIIANYEVKLTKNLALQFKIKNTGAFLNPRLDDRQLDYVNTDLDIEIIAGEYPFLKLNAQYYAEIFFTDEIGTPYKQILRGDIHDLKISPPLRIK